MSELTTDELDRKSYEEQRIMDMEDLEDFIKDEKLTFSPVTKAGLQAAMSKLSPDPEPTGSKGNDIQKIDYFNTSVPGVVYMKTTNFRPNRDPMVNSKFVRPQSTSER